MLKNGNKSLLKPTLENKTRKGEMKTKMKMGLHAVAISDCQGRAGLLVWGRSELSKRKQRAKKQTLNQTLHPTKATAAVKSEMAKEISIKMCKENCGKIRLKTPKNKK